MGAASWQLERLPPDAKAVADALPAEHEHVLAWVSDEDAAIYHFPVVAWRVRDRWWAGVPASYIDLKAKRWAVTHWKALS
jgi:hypothetical protein